MVNRSELIEKLKATLDQERFEHSLRVETIALQLGKKWQVSEKLVRPAALLHDCARRFSRKELLSQAVKIGLKIDPIRKFEPKLFHAEISAYLAQKEFGVKSRAILNAISRHTIGSAGMSQLEKIIYLADHIEEGRDFKGVNKMRDLAFKDLDQAIIVSASNMIGFLLENDLPIHPGTIETRNYYLLKLK